MGYCYATAEKPRPLGRGEVTLAPLYDFAPMCLATAAIGRSTRWRCLHGKYTITDGRWDIVFDTVAAMGVPLQRLRNALIDRMELLLELPECF